MTDVESTGSNAIDSTKLSGGLCREVIVVLDLASLETVKTKKGDFQLLNCDDHVGIMRKHNKDPAKFRPDIAHQVHRRVNLNDCN